MKISLLNEKITFEKNTVTVDENANHKNEWSEYFTCHAYADTSGAKGEKESAGDNSDGERLGIYASFLQRAFRT